MRKILTLTLFMVLTSTLVFALGGGGGIHRKGISEGSNVTFGNITGVDNIYTNNLYLNYSGTNSRIAATSNGVYFEDGIDYINTANWDTATHHTFGSTGIDGHELGATACQVSIDDDNTKIRIADCDYHIDGTHYSFDAISGIDPNFLPGQNSAYIAVLPFGAGTGRATVFDAITSTGPTPYSTAQKLGLIPLARLNTPDGELGAGSSVKLIRTDRFFITPLGYDDRIYHEEAIGALYVDGGNIFSNNTALIIGQRAGILYDSRKVRHVLAAFNSITAVFVHYSSNGQYADRRDRFIVDNARCGNGLNTGLENMLPNRWCNNKILKSPKGTNGVQEGGLFYVYGTKSYGTQAAAAVEDFDFGLFVSEYVSGLTPVAEILIETSSTTPVIVDRRKCLVCVKSIN